MNPKGTKTTAIAQQLLLVALGAIPGALLRWQAAVQLGPHFPAGASDLLVNGLGSLLLGWLVAWAPSRQGFKLLLGVGFCGSLTTFSSWMLMVVQLQQQGGIGALLWLALGLTVGLSMAWLGLLLGQRGNHP